MATQPDNLQALFGGTMLPQDMQQELINQRAQQFAQLTPSQQLGALGYKTGAAIGGGLAQAMGVDITDPRIKRQAQLQQLAQGVENTPDGLKSFAQKLSNAGFTTEAAQAMDKAREIELTQAKTTSLVEDKQAAREQQLMLAREKMQSAEQLARDRNDIMLQIAQMNAALRGSNNDVQRQLIEQRIEDLKVKADEKQATLQSQAQGRIAAFDSALETLDVISKHPGKKDVVGALSGGVMSVIPGTQAAGFSSQLETFKAQTFIPMVATLKGMGALSDAEGKKLTAAVGALDPKMPKKEFDDQITKIKRDLESARQRASTMPGAPKQGTETPAAPAKKVIKFSDL